MIHVWKGHGVDSEIGSMSARQAALNRWTATDKRWTSIRLFIHSIRVFLQCFDAVG